MDRKSIIEGELVVYSSEGGFAPDGIEINGKDFAEILADHFDLPLDCRGSLGDLVHLGKVKITIESK